MPNDKDTVEAKTAWPVDRFTREVCRAVGGYSKEVQEIAIRSFYQGKKLATAIKLAKNI